MTSAESRSRKFALLIRVGGEGGSAVRQRVSGIVISEGPDKKSQQAEQQDFRGTRNRIPTVSAQSTIDNAFNLDARPASRAPIPPC